MVFKVDSIQLPKYPSTIQETNPADVKSYPFPGDKPIVVSQGLQLRTLEVQGILVEAGKTKAQLKSSYIDPLRAKIHTTVVLTTNEALYDGTWLFESFIPLEDIKKAGTRGFSYKMKFIQGSSYVVL